MSDLQNAIRQFGDAVKEGEERLSNNLGEVRDGIRATGNDVRRRVMTQMAKIDKAIKEIERARAEIIIILDEAETADKHIMAEIEQVRLVTLSPNETPQIGQKGTTNG